MLDASYYGSFTLCFTELYSHHSFFKVFYVTIFRLNLGANSNARSYLYEVVDCLITRFSMHMHTAHLPATIASIQNLILFVPSKYLLQKRLQQAPEQQ